MRKLLIIAGPTAAGKTALSVALAQKLNGEIISADAMQIYAGMEIGTAAATERERQGIAHHLIGCIDPAEHFSAAQYQSLAERIAQEIRMRGRIPIAVGGTGLYIDALCYDLSFMQAAEDKAFRAEMQDFAERNGAEALYERLMLIDPESAVKLHVNDRKRIIRALEIYHVSGIKKSEQERHWKEPKPGIQVCMIVLGCENRAYLYERINRRVDAMIAEGLEEEVRRLLALGIPETAQSLQAIGYKELISYFNGNCSRQEAIEAIKRESRRYAKRQLTWFKRQEKAHWIDIENQTLQTLVEQAEKVIERDWRQSL